MRLTTRILFSFRIDGGAHGAPASRGPRRAFSARWGGTERRGVAGPRKRPSRGVGRSPTLVRAGLFGRHTPVVFLGFAADAVDQFSVVWRLGAGRAQFGPELLDSTQPPAVFVICRLMRHFTGVSTLFRNRVVRSSARLEENRPGVSNRTAPGWPGTYAELCLPRESHRRPTHALIAPRGTEFARGEPPS